MRAVAAVVLVALAIAACAPAPAGSSPSLSARPAKDKVKLPSVISTELNLPSLVAYAKDFFGEQNIEVTDFVLGTSATLRNAMIAKEYDFGLFAFVHDPLARLAGSPWKAVLSTHDREIFSLIIRSQLKDSIKSVADLRGKNVGVTSPGSGSWAMANVYLKKVGLTPDKDVSLVNLGGDPAAIYTALQTGKVDAILSWEPVTSRVLETGVGAPLVAIYQPGTEKEWLGSEKALALALMTREDVIQSKRDLVQRMVKAHQDALSFIAKTDAGAIADLILGNPKTAEQFAGIDRSLLARLIDRIKSGFGTGCLSKSGFEAEMSLSVQYQLVKQPITFQDFADTSFAGDCP
ncbi:MAG TPA: ABC transporter substrate-binding protein [Candidatus Dormibacteraeota bacterium]|jgi:NitT/TauT family transport system substrate-binding protein|nr:ABC transporter substrate-binding protein [Candidatus Dormibacteraeota bacterium]